MFSCLAGIRCGLRHISKHSSEDATVSTVIQNIDNGVEADAHQQKHFRYHDYQSSGVRIISRCSKTFHGRHQHEKQNVQNIADNKYYTNQQHRPNNPGIHLSFFRLCIRQGSFVLFHRGGNFSR